MELRHLRYFTAVAEHLNYSEAARRLHVAQPAVSQTVLDLEEELGLPLLLRDRRTVRLTAAGETFRREALDILRRQEEAARLARRAARGEVGRLRIGFFSMATALFLPGLVQEYHRRFPTVELTLLELTPAEQLAAFDEDRIDVGFSRALPPKRQEEFQEATVYEDCLHLALPAAHRLVSEYAREPAVPVAQLAREPFVLFHRQGAPALYDEALSLCARAGDFTPQVVNEPGMMLTVVLLVESGLGVLARAGLHPSCDPGGQPGCLQARGPVFQAHRTAAVLAAAGASAAHREGVPGSGGEPTGGHPPDDGNQVPGRARPTSWPQGKQQTFASKLALDCQVSAPSASRKPPPIPPLR